MMRLWFALSLLPLAACTLQNPSFVNQQKIQLVPEEVSYARPATQVTATDMAELADQITHRGQSDVVVHVTYPLYPQAANNQKLANAQAARIRQALMAGGVKRPIHIDLKGEGIKPPNQVEVTFQAIQAQSPCEHDISEGDADNYTHAKDSPYQMGCARDKYLSAMIARPEDLLGNTTTSTMDSQRLSKSLDTYRAGEPATPPSSTLSASDVYK